MVKNLLVICKPIAFFFSLLGVGNEVKCFNSPVYITAFNKSYISRNSRTVGESDSAGMIWVAAPALRCLPQFVATDFSAGLTANLVSATSKFEAFIYNFVKVYT